MESTSSASTPVAESSTSATRGLTSFSPIELSSEEAERKRQETLTKKRAARATAQRKWRAKQRAKEQEHIKRSKERSEPLSASGTVNGSTSVAWMKGTETGRDVDTDKGKARVVSANASTMSHSAVVSPTQPATSISVHAPSTTTSATISTTPRHRLKGYDYEAMERRKKRGLAKIAAAWNAANSSENAPALSATVESAIGNDDMEEVEKELGKGGPRRAEEEEDEEVTLALIDDPNAPKPWRHPHEVLYYDSKMVPFNSLSINPDVLKKFGLSPSAGIISSGRGLSIGLTVAGWTQDLIMKYLLTSAFSIPPRDVNIFQHYTCVVPLFSGFLETAKGDKEVASHALSAGTWLTTHSSLEAMESGSSTSTPAPESNASTSSSQRQLADPICLPRGYRIPLMFLEKFQWESLRLMLQCQNPNSEWEEFIFDVMHVARVVRVFFEEAKKAKLQGEERARNLNATLPKSTAQDKATQHIPWLTHTKLRRSANAGLALAHSLGIGLTGAGGIGAGAGTDFQGRVPTGEFDKSWRCAQIDRVLTRVYQKWLVPREWSLRGFWIDWGEEEYEIDVLRHDWARWANRGAKGFTLSKEEIITGITAEEYLKGLGRTKEGKWIWKGASGGGVGNGVSAGLSGAAMGEGNSYGGTVNKAPAERTGMTLDVKKEVMERVLDVHGEEFTIASHMTIPADPQLLDIFTKITYPPPMASKSVNDVLPTTQTSTAVPADANPLTATAAPPITNSNGHRIIIPGVWPNRRPITPTIITEFSPGKTVITTLTSGTNSLSTTTTQGGGEGGEKEKISSLQKSQGRTAKFFAETISKPRAATPPSTSTSNSGAGSVGTGRAVPVTGNGVTGIKTVPPVPVTTTASTSAVSASPLIRPPNVVSFAPNYNSFFERRSTSGLITTSSSGSTTTSTGETGKGAAVGSTSLVGGSSSALMSKSTSSIATPAPVLASTLTASPSGKLGAGSTSKASSVFAEHVRAMNQTKKNGTITIPAKKNRLDNESPNGKKRKRASVPMTAEEHNQEAKNKHSEGESSSGMDVESEDESNGEDDDVNDKNYRHQPMKKRRVNRSGTSEVTNATASQTTTAITDSSMTTENTRAVKKINLDPDINAPMKTATAASITTDSNATKRKKTGSISASPNDVHSSPPTTLATKKARMEGADKSKPMEKDNPDKVRKGEGTAVQSIIMANVSRTAEENLPALGGSIVVASSSTTTAILSKTNGRSDSRTPSPMQIDPPSPTREGPAHVSKVSDDTPLTPEVPTTTTSQRQALVDGSPAPNEILSPQVEVPTWESVNGASPTTIQHGHPILTELVAALVQERHRNPHLSPDEVVLPPDVIYSVLSALSPARPQQVVTDMTTVMPQPAQTLAPSGSQPTAFYVPETRVSSSGAYAFTNGIPPALSASPPDRTGPSVPPHTIDSASSSAVMLPGHPRTPTPDPEAASGSSALLPSTSNSLPGPDQGTSSVFMPAGPEDRIKSIHTILLLRDLLAFLKNAENPRVRPQTASISNTVSNASSSSFVSTLTSSAISRKNDVQLTPDERLDITAQVCVALAKLLFPHRGADLNVRINTLDMKLQEEFEKLDGARELGKGGWLGSSPMMSEQDAQQTTRQTSRAAITARSMRDSETQVDTLSEVMVEMQIQTDPIEAPSIFTRESGPMLVDLPPRIFQAEAIQTDPVGEPIRTRISHIEEPSNQPPRHDADDDYDIASTPHNTPPFTISTPADVNGSGNSIGILSPPVPPSASNSSLTTNIPASLLEPINGPGKYEKGKGKERESLVVTSEIELIKKQMENERRRYEEDVARLHDAINLMREEKERDRRMLETPGSIAELELLELRTRIVALERASRGRSMSTDRATPLHTPVVVDRGHFSLSHSISQPSRRQSVYSSHPLGHLLGTEDEVDPDVDVDIDGLAFRLTSSSSPSYDYHPGVGSAAGSHRSGSAAGRALQRSTSYPDPLSIFSGSASRPMTPATPQSPAASVVSSIAPTSAPSVANNDKFMTNSRTSQPPLISVPTPSGSYAHPLPAKNQRKFNNMKGINIFSRPGSGPSDSTNK